MAIDARPSSFVTGAAGFLGAELVEVLVSRGHEVVGLIDSVEAAERVRRAGGVPVIGDLLTSGRWQDEAAADWVFHLPPHPLAREQGCRSRPASAVRERLSMDLRLLDAVAAGTTRRIVYVADTSWYGALGRRAATEDESPRPSGWGRRLAPALNRIDGYALAGLPIVTAFTGLVYGTHAPWLRRHVIDPVMAGQRVLQFGRRGVLISPIHAQDCARALVHLAERGEPGGRYFLVNSEPARTNEFAETFARLAERPLRPLRVPPAMGRLVVDPILAEHVRADAVFSNTRLRGLGFDFRYPTLEHGLRQVLGAVDG